MPADRCWIEEHLRAKERGDPRGFRIPLVPADEDTNRCVARLPDLESIGFAGSFTVVIKMTVARREVILLVKEGIVRDVHLPVDAKQRTVGIDDGGGISIDTCRLTLEERDNDRYLKLPRDRLHALGRRSGNRFCQVKSSALLSFAEVLRIEELFQTDDLCPAPGSVPHEPFGPGNVGRDISGGVILDEADGEGRVGHVRTTVYGRSAPLENPGGSEDSPLHRNAELSRGCSAAAPGRMIFRMFSGSSPVLGLILLVPRAAVAMCICRRMARATWWMA